MAASALVVAVAAPVVAINLRDGDDTPPPATVEADTDADTGAEPTPDPNAGAPGLFEPIDANTSIAPANVESGGIEGPVDAPDDVIEPIPADVPRRDDPVESTSALVEVELGAPAVQAADSPVSVALVPAGADVDLTTDEPDASTATTDDDPTDSAAADEPTDTSNETDAPTEPTTEPDPEPDIPEVVAEVEGEAPGPDPAVVEQVQINVLDQDDTLEVGLEKVAFTVQARPTNVAPDTTVRLTVDYSEFEESFGADWAGRLQVVTFDSCWLTDPDALECEGPQPVDDVANDRVSGQISVDVPIEELQPTNATLSGAGESVIRLMSTGGPGFGLSAGAYSNAGNYATSDLSSTGSWAVGKQAGNFNYSYPIDAPAPPAGPAPSVAYSYSSQTIDGLTSDQNTQGGVLGPGWSNGSMFIERRYKSCFNDGGGTGDLCYVDDNAVISLGGITGELVNIGPATAAAGWAGAAYRVSNAPGWVFKRFWLTGVEWHRGAYGIDNDHEYWVAHDPDGTKYWFGYGNRSGDFAVGTELGSSWTVPVRGIHAGRPCYVLSGHWCHQTYRWMLDRTETATGMATNYRYTREQNYYGVLGAPYNTQPYVSGGRLESISYGLTEEMAGQANVEQSLRTNSIDFYYAYRCTTLNTSCAAPTKTTGANYPDIPADQLCDTTAPCYKYSPTFFDRTFLTKTVTMTRTSGSQMLPVKQFVNHFEWVDADGGGPDPQRLWLRTIERYGHNNLFNWVGPEFLGDVRFDGPTHPDTGLPWAMPNRVDHNVPAGVTEMKYWRIGRIRDELGSLTSVTYTQPRLCSIPPVEGDWALNTASCYPRWWTPPAGPAGFGIWHKWVVGKVHVSDLRGVSPDVVTSYHYPDVGTGPMAWRHDRDRYTIASQKSWSDYRGFDTVEETVGTGGDAVRTVYRYFRGLHGDKACGGCSTTKTVLLTTSLPPNISSSTILDYEWNAGQPLETYVPNPAATSDRTQDVSRTSYTYTTPYNYGVNPRAAWVMPYEEFRYNSGEYSRTLTTYDSLVRLSRIHEFGRTDALYNDTSNLSGHPDARCTAISYSQANERFPHGLPVRTTLHEDSTCTTAAISDESTFYDGAVAYPPSATAQWPSAGQVTATVRSTGPGVVNINHVVLGTVGETFTYENNGYASPSGWGRVAHSYDALGGLTTHLYVTHAGNAPLATPNVVHSLASVTVTNPAGHVTTTRFDAYQNNISTTNPMGGVTEACYDRHGRLTHVFGPLDPKPASHHYSALCSSNDATDTYAYTRQMIVPIPAVPGTSTVGVWSTQSRSKYDTNRFTETRTILDGLGRVVQTKEHSPSGGAILTRTVYDSAGRVVRQSEPFHYNTAVDHNVITFAHSSIPTEHQTVYDWAGRVVTNIVRDNDVEIRRANTSYWLYTATTTPYYSGSNPYGSTTTTFDAYGQTIRVEEWDPVGGNANTFYRYNARGETTEILKPGHTVPTYLTYNQLGWLVGVDEPDAGHRSTRYFATGETAAEIDGAGRYVYTEIDALGRPTGTFDGGIAEWARLTKYTYDSPAIGVLDIAESYQPAGTLAYRYDTTAVDGAGRVTGSQVTVPAADDPAVAGDEVLAQPIDFSSTFLPGAGLVRTETMPGKAGWSLANPETITHDYDLGRPTKGVGDLGSYLHTQTYTPDGKPDVSVLRGWASAVGFDIDRNYQASDGRLSTVTANRTGGFGAVVADTYHYDPAGNISRIERDPVGTAEDVRECFDYDARQRLVRGYTTAFASGACPGANDSTVPTGAAAYNTSYSYHLDDRFATNDGRSYDYTTINPPVCNGQTRPQPSAVKSITAVDGRPAESITYDCNGSMTSRTGGTVEPRDGSIVAGGSFENGAVGWDHIAVEGITNIAVYNDASVAHSGSHYLATNTSGIGGSVYHDRAVSVAAGTPITASAWVRSAVGTSTGSFCVSATGISSDEESCADYDVGTVWEKVEVVLDVAASHDNVRLQVFPARYGGTVYVDTVHAHTKSFVGDGSFRSNAAGWIANQAGGVTNFAVYDDQATAHDGSRYLATNTNVGGGSVLQNITRSIDANTRVTASAWLRSSAGTTSGLFCAWVMGYSAPQQVCDDYSVGTEWEHHEVVLDANATQTIVRIEIYPVANSGTTFIDTVTAHTESVVQHGSFEAGNSWSVYHGNGFTNYGSYSSPGGGHEGDRYFATNTSATDGNGSIYLDNPASVAAGSVVTASAWVRGSSAATTGTFCVWAMGVSGNEQSCATYSVGTEWTEVEVVLDATGAHDNIRVQLYPTVWAPTVVIDTVSAHAHSIGHTGGFESGSPWSYTNGTGLTNIAIYDTAADAHDGSRFLATNTDHTGGSVIQDTPISIDAGESVRASAWVRSSAGTTSGTFCAWAIGISGNEGSCSDYDVGTDWEEVEVVLDPTGQHSVLRLQVYPTPNAGTTYIDTVTADANSLIANGSFEAGTGWTAINAGGITNHVVYVDAAVAHDGSRYYATNTSAAGGALYVDRPMSIGAGEAITASAWVRSSVGQTSGSFCAWAMGLTTDESSCTAYDVGPEWTKVEVVLDPTTPHNNLRVNFYPTPHGGTTLFDTVSVHASSLFFDGSIEGADAWDVIEAGGLLNRGIYVDANEAHDGVRYYATNTDTGGASLYKDHAMNIDADSAFTASMWVKAPVGQVSGTFCLWAMGISGNVQSCTDYDVGTEWEQIEVVLDPTGDHSALRVQVYPTPHGGTTLFDTVSVTANEAATVDPATFDYAWTANNRLESVTVTDSAGVHTSRNVYDPAGQRVLRVDPDGSKTLYLGSTMLRWAPGDPTVRVARSYPGGVHRRFDGTLDFNVANHQGSIVATLNETTGMVTHNHYDPYGSLRSGELTNDKGFLHQTHDPTQGLVYLNARSYDPTIGVFTSVDPLVLATGEPYIYGAANPVVFTDQSGLSPCSFSACPDGIPVTHYGQPDQRSLNWPILRETKAYGPAKELHDAMRVDGPAGRWERSVGDVRRTGGHRDTFNIFRLVFDWECEGWGCGIEVAGIIPFGKILKAFKALKHLDNAGDARHATGGPPAPTRGGAGPVRQGQAGVDQAIDDLEAAGGRVLGREITVEAAGVRSRPDLFVELPCGTQCFLEVKTGPGAKLTTNQSTVFPEIRAGNAVARGSNAAAAGFTPGAPIAPTPVWVIHQPWPL